MFDLRHTRLFVRTVAAVAGLSCVTGIALAQDMINTFAGNGQAAYSGDGGAASAAAVNYPKGVAVDTAGNIYIADTQNMRVRRVSPTGTISTVAGNGTNAYSGDGGQAVAASLSDVTGVAVDATGNLYIGDDSNRRIRKVAANGVITTIAGVGVQGYSGDGGLAVNAMIGRAEALALDSAGNLYFADSVNQVIRKIDTNGIITTVAGNGLEGFSGDGGLATAASLDFPIGITVDTAGSIYIADGNNNRIRKVTGGIITTVAGNGTSAFAGDNGQAINASINIPSDVSVDLAGNMYIADAGNNRVRVVSPAGIITTLAGTDANGYSGDGGPATQAMLNFPWGLAVSRTGNLYIGDRANSRIRTVNQNIVTTPTPTLVNNPALNAASFVTGLAVAPGSIVSIFGSNLSIGNGSDLSAPLPYQLANTSLLINGAPAPLFFVSPTQINAQVPFNLPVGSAQIQVQSGASLSAVASIPVATYSPGIFIVDYNANAGAIIHTNNYSVVSASNPAARGETLAMYVTGLGPVNMAIASGAAAPSSAPYAMTLVTPTVKIGGVNANVIFSGLAPGYVGLYQLNVTVPTSIAAGSQSVQVIIGGIASNSAILPVQ